MWCTKIKAYLKCKTFYTRYQSLFVYVFKDAKMYIIYLTVCYLYVCDFCRVPSIDPIFYICKLTMTEQNWSSASDLYVNICIKYHYIVIKVVRKLGMIFPTALTIKLNITKKKRILTKIVRAIRSTRRRN